MTALAWSGGGLVLVAGLAGWRERRRKARRDPDAVGAVDWATVQILALVSLAIVVGLLMHA